MPGTYPSYGSAYWKSNTSTLGQGGWSYSLPAAGVLETDITEGSYPNYYTCNVYSNYIFHDTSGGSHALGLGSGQSPNGSCLETPVTPGGDAQFAGSLANNGLAWGTLSVFSADGTVYQFNSLPYSNDDSVLGFPAYIEDRNGNRITPSGNSFLDTLGRSVISWDTLLGTSARPTNLLAGGLSYQITWKTTTAGFSTASTWVGSNLGPNSTFGTCTSGVPAVNDSQTVISQISLPNGKKFTFYYGTDNPDPNFQNPYGMLSEIDYPDGGWVKYKWKLSDTMNELLDYPGIISQNCNGTVMFCPKAAPDYCLYQYKTPVVASRLVGFGGSSNPALTQTFIYSTFWGSTPPGDDGPNTWATKTTNMTTVDNLTGKSALTAYSYSPINLPNPPYNNSSLLPQAPVESTVSYYDWGNTTSPLRTVNKNWYDQFNISSQTTVLENGQSSKITYCYVGGSCVPSRLSQLQETDEYDFGASSPSRKTVTTFQSFTGTPGIINDAPCKVLTQNGSSTTVAETDYLYDGAAGTCGAGTASVAAVNGLPAGTHDETLFGSGSGIPRGNPTKVIKKCLQSCSDAITTYAYDETGQVLSATDACGNATCSDIADTTHTTTYSYADNFDSPPAGNTNAYLTAITRPTTSNGVSHTEHFKYAFVDGQLISSTDENGQVTGYAYSDPLRRLSETDYPDAGRVVLSYNDAAPNPSVTASRLLNSSGQYITTVQTMDGLGHVIQSKLITDPDCASGDITATSYDGFGRVLSVSNPYCSTADPIYGFTQYVYDGLGRTTQVKNQDNTVVTTVYSGPATEVTDEGNGSFSVQRISQVDGLGRLKFVCEVGQAQPFGADASPSGCGLVIGGNGFLTSYDYDYLDNLTSVSQRNHRNRSFSYDSLSRLLSASNPESGTINYAYDANGNLATKVAPAPNQIQAQPIALIGTQTIASGHDDNVSGLAEAFQATASASGQLSSVTVYVDSTSTASQLIAGVYTNSSGRPGTLITQGSIASPQAGAWNTVAVTPASLTQSTAYWIAILGTGGTLRFRDSSGCTSVNSSQSNLSSLPATWSNGPTYSTCPVSAYGTGTQGGQGATTVTTSYSYDSLNRLLSKSYSDGVTPSASYVYDVSHIDFVGPLSNTVGRQVKASADNGCAVTYSGYDAMGRIAYQAEVVPVCFNYFVFSYQYDLAGNLISQPDGDFDNFALTRNGAGRLTKMESHDRDWEAPYFSSVPLSGITYNAAGQITSETLGNGEVTTYTYDKRLRLQAANSSRAGTTLYAFNLTFAPDSDVLASTDTANGNWNYAYDPLNRLICTNAASNGTCLAPTNGTPTYTYQYDRFGNRWHQNGPNAMILTFNNENNQPDGYTFDLAGNLRGDGSHCYQYDAENRISTVFMNDCSTVVATYIYDANGYRVHQTGYHSDTCSPNDGIRDFGYDIFGHQTFEHNSGGTGCRIEVYAGSRHLATYAGSEAFIHSDWLGTERFRKDFYPDQTNYQQTCSSLPFGDGFSCSVIGGGDPSPMHFTGKMHDNESGLDNFGARYNSSQMGRFMSPDPMGGHTEDPQTLNRYAYVANNPLNRTDPTGLDWYLGCTTSDHSGCKQVQIDPNNKKSLTWVQTGKDGNATIITSDSIRAGQNTATVSENGVQINGKNQGIYFENPANDASHWADGKDHNQIDLAGSGALKNFNFHIDGNCSGTCRSSGEWTRNANSYGTIGDLLTQRGAFTNSGEDAVAFFGYGAHPYSTQYRFGGPLNSPHLSVPYDRPGTVPSDPTLNVPRSGGFHVDSHSDWRHAIDVAQGKPE